MSKKNTTKTYYGAASSLRNIPNDCTLYDSMQDLIEEAANALGLADGENFFSVKIVLSEPSKHKLVVKTTESVKKVDLLLEEVDEL
jgi:hypothetical protein